MEKNVLIVKNITREGPGILQEILEDRGIQSTLVDLDRGDSLPLLDEYSAVIVLGGPDSANDESEKMRDELEFVRDVISRKIPYLGICLGLQVLVKAAGGEVVKNPVREIGFRDPENHRFAVDLTETGRMDSIFDGLADRLEVFHLHGETVVLTDGTRLLASGKFCTNQVVKV